MAAVDALATSELALADRLQVAWAEHVQKVWMQPCLTRELLARFRDLWHRYTAPSDDRRSTKLRPLTHEESALAISELVAFTMAVSVAAATASADTQLATLADLG